MTSHKQREQRMTMPGGEPTDEDLKLDAELTRQELADTVAALGAKADVKGRARAAAKQRVEAIQTGGAQLMEKLPAPVARKVAPVWTTVSHRPAVPLGGLVALIAAVVVWLKIRKR